jgi:hypothetical protein
MLNLSQRPHSYVEKKDILEGKTTLAAFADKTRNDIQYCKISKEILSRSFGLDVFCQFEARIPEFEARVEWYNLT